MTTRKNSIEFLSLKCCTLCHKVKSLDAFSFNGTDRRGHGRLRSSCKECRALQARGQYQLRAASITVQKRSRRLVDGDRIRAQERARQSSHSASMIAANQRRRARLKNAPVNDHTAAQWLAIKVIYRWSCVYCGKKTAALTQDHIIPLSKGGSHTMENIVPACAHCNSKKGGGKPLIPVQPVLLLKDLA